MITMEPFRAKLFIFISLCAASLAQQQQYIPLSGPNVCGPKFYSYCCPGWTRHDRFNTCTVPVCNLGSCQGGYCIRPNSCYCNGGRLSVGGCGASRVNGGQQGGQTGIGYPGSGPQGPQPVSCTPPCRNGGRCIGQNRCSCSYGFAGQSCETDFRTGACYTVMEDGQCEGLIQGLLCTKALCCATVGQGWGSPCVSCDTFDNPCERGFFVDARTLQCQDADECEQVPGLCQDGECVNTIGSYMCNCPRGYVLDILTQRCADVDECDNTAICENGQCINRVGGFRCECNPGYEYDESRSICVREGTSPTDPPFICPDGWEYNSDSTDCIDTGPPTRFECPSNSQEEIRDDGSRVCILDVECRTGYTLSADGKTCVPPDHADCLAGEYLADNGECYRLAPGDCPEGFDLLSDGITCRGPDGRILCPAGSRLSSNGRMCIRDPGVNCEPGEAMENGQCVTILAGHCPQDYILADDGVTCFHYLTGYFFCPAGYVFSRQMRRCVLPGGGGCSLGYSRTEAGFCAPFPPGECPDGFQLLNDGVTCFNSETGTYFCPENFRYNFDRMRCELRMGVTPVPPTKGFCYARYRASRDMCSRSLAGQLSQFQCCCEENMEGWGLSEDDCSPCPYGADFDRFCEEVRPTIPPLGICANTQLCPNGQCVSTRDGSYQCMCLEGYQGVGSQRCIDIDECRDDSYCVNGVCRNTQGSFVCTCGRGYQLSRDSTTCIDMDECETNEETCMHGLCYNTEGSYICDCFEGYKLSVNEKYCYDIDECQGGRMCRNGRCTNTEGSYECTCNPGYELSQNNLCEDTNECLDQACGPGSCENTPGSYRCTCPSGFIESGGVCTERSRAFCYISTREGRCSLQSSMPVTISQCCCSVVALEQSLSWGPGCEPCPPQRSQMYEKLCVQGSGWDSFGININECLIFGTLCDNGMCEDLSGNYRCNCNSGFRLTDGSKICEDDNECAVNRRLCSGGNCRNTPGSYVCDCPDGYSLDSSSGTCRDEDECLENPCVDGRCRNLRGSYRCECILPGMTLDVSGRICEDNRIGVCWTSIRGGRCEANIMGVMRRDECCATFGQAWGSPCEPCQSSSSCRPGYIPRLEGCEDIDECAINPMLCTNGRCINTDGSYQCICNDGLTLDTSGTMCVDVQSYKCYLDYAEEECFDAIIGVYRKSVCCCSVGLAYGQGADCNPCPEYDTVEWEELCPDGSGFADVRDSTDLMDGSIVIEDINECTVFEDACENGDCLNHIGYFDCECEMGFALDYDYTCVDVDECSILIGVCGNGVCENRPGTFDCHCQEGYASFSVMMPTCEDVNECNTMPNICRGGYCQNTLGSFRCVCPEGQELTLEGMACRDIDECSSIHGICSNGECTNMIGTYRCMCDEGFRPTANFKACEDMDECDMHKGGCDQLCVNTQGSFHCDCKPGYALMGDGTTCRDRNECEDDPLICSGGDCTNEIGSHRCSCLEGYEESADLKMCLDINECFQNICQFGDCSNVIGGYVCQCDFGYSEKEGEPGCTDDDECLMGIHDCAINTVCRNTIGSFECVCAPGFIQVGEICIDVDECESLSADCHISGLCVNTDGSYQCTCQDGYIGDGRDCRDFDECMHNQDLCRNGQCLNFPGGYNCECDDGFFRNPDSGECDDVNECELGNLCVYGDCLNYPGNYRCDCYDGFVLDSQGGNCTDVDECEDPDFYCTNGNCTNFLGSYMCDCPDLYTLSEDGTQCLDEREGLCYGKVMDADRGDSALMCVNIIASVATRWQCCCLAGKGWGDPCTSCPTENSTEYVQLCPKKPVNIGGNGKPGGPDDPDGGSGDDGDGNGGGIGSDNGGGNGGGDNGGGDNGDGGGDNGGGGTGGGNNGFPGQNECELFTLCRMGTCLNTAGGYKCICDTPYFEYNPDSMSCEDVNECENDYICGPGRCINLQGGYECQCPTGFMFVDSVFGQNCMDIRELHCYLTVNETANYTECFNSQPVPGILTTQKQCCCSGLRGEAWGDEDSCNACPTPDAEEYYTICGPHRGTQTSEDGTAVDIDECDIDGLCQNGVCRNEEGNFHCECALGYEYNEETLTCEDVDECASNTDRCMGRAYCVNILGNHVCKCPDGFELTRSGVSCIDTDECSTSPGICGNGECTNRQGTHQCSCHQGYEESEDRRSCVDVNECRVDYYRCGNGTCLNMEGSYECDCHYGFERDEIGHCRDVDECSTLMGRCPNGECINTIGSFFCNCMDGYTPQGHNMACTDVDECSDLPLICANGFCINFVGGHRCECNDGFQSVQVSQNYHGETCEDRDECSTIPDLCTGGTCINVDGSFECDCPSGYVADKDGSECIDMRRGTCFDLFIDSRCDANRSNNVTKYDCCCTGSAGWGIPCELCPQQGTEAFLELCANGLGYRPGVNLEDNTVDLDVFMDIDECKMFPSECINGDCINTDGSYRCECGPGRQLDSSGKVCEDVDECLIRGNNICGKNSTCLNVPGSFQCLCGEGFQTGRGGRCEDINECRRGRNLCAFRCENLPGTFRCICPRGFALGGDGRLCRDFDECASGENNCRYGCQNLIGKFMCTCHEGYQAVGGDGNVCRDIDECSSRHGLCENGICMNVPGSYQCVCNPGFVASADNSECVDQRRGTCYGILHQGVCQAPISRIPSITMGQCCCNGAEAWGDNCESCPTFGTSEYLDLCSETLVPIDHCASITGLCENGYCLSGNGGYICKCNPGYGISREGNRCVDKDECDTNMCSHECRNTQGGFKCLCPPGYVLSHDMVTCEDEDECRNNNLCGSFGTCQNTPGGYRCECQRNFRQDESGTMCVDIDECQEQPHRCQYDCQNTLGGYTCGCPDGYIQNYWGQCGDQNECATQGTCGSAQCYNTQGSYQCSCQNGFILDQQSLSCNDINECQGYGYGGQSPCQSSCENTPGSFACGCPSGYYSFGQGSCFQTYGQESEVPCYSCTQTGDQQRQKRSADAPSPDALPGVVANNTVILIRVPLSKAQSNARVLKLTTGYSPSVGVFSYQILSGNEDGAFVVDSRREGKALLRLSRALNRPGIYSLDLEGKIVEGTEALEVQESDKTVITEPIDLLVEIDIFE